ncbi:lymphocyte cytosolic protein 2-like [Lates japonicus]
MFESDEFDSESDNDYESPEQEEDDDRYICALAKAQTAEQQDSEESFDGNYLPLASAETMKPPRPPRASKLQGSHSRDPAHDPCPAERTSKPPPPRRMNPSPQRPLKTPAPPPPSQPNLHIDRSKKPGQPTPTQRAPPNSKGSTVKALRSSTLKLPKPWTPKPSDRTSKLSLSPPVPTQPATINYSILRQKQGLDPSWYGGKVTRNQAEAALREMNKDGAFVVRDSSKGSADHPYTLMLLKEGKVYNIKIRNQGGSYSLGNGLNNKSFPGVEEMITHHKHTPLLLIDATDQSSEGHSQSCLLYPAGP